MEKTSYFFGKLNTIILFAFLFSTNAIVLGQKSEKTPEKKAQIWISKVKDTLNLTSDQESKFKTLIINRETQKNKDYKDFINDKNTLKSKNKARNEKYKSDLKNILTPTQYQLLYSIINSNNNRKELVRKLNKYKKDKKTAKDPVTNKTITYDEELMGL